jgi:hypothetical protein
MNEVLINLTKFKHLEKTREDIEKKNIKNTKRM